jgi:hypothetical protein
MKKIKTVKYSVLLRYYAMVKTKLHKSRLLMDEQATIYWKERKMKLIFLERPIFKDYAKNGFTADIEI